MTKIWAVTVQGEDSWGTNNDTYETVSLHASEEGAKKKAALVTRGMALYYFTRGECSNENLSPDEILTILSKNHDKKRYNQLKTEISKSGADFWKALITLNGFKRYVGRGCVDA